jgi:60 kDa SS-A/Ro ribonucleoprotein
MSAASKQIAAALTNPAAVRKSRLHPMAILIAHGVYKSGHGRKGKLSWTPVPQVVDALDDAFYLGFANCVPTGKNWLLGIDVSGSMASPFGGSIAGGLSCAQVAAVMAMVTMRTEKNWYCHGFRDQFVDLGLTAKMTLDQVLSKTAGEAFDTTDCAVPMTYALAHKVPVDTFVVYTDHETWYGAIHPFQALRQYREQMNPQAKLIVVGIAATGFTIADPSDAGMLDVVGFDASAPAVMADFARS